MTTLNYKQLLLNETIQLKQATNADDLTCVRELFTEYERWLGVDLCFQNFSQELRDLPGKYEPPRGSILIAWDGRQAAGVVGMRPFDEAHCEMKRLFVRPMWRSQGTGRRLTQAIVSNARRAEYKSMRLDTLTRLTEALGLYRSMGFREVPPYYDNPLGDVVFLELDLNE